MSKLLWLLWVVGLVLIGLLLACGSNYNPSSNGLVVVGSQGAGLIETFSFSLNGGGVNAIGNSPNDTANDSCVLNALPASIVMDPAGAYAYAILTGTSSCGGQHKKGIMAFKVNSDGTTTAVGSLVPDTNPVGLFMDSAGKFLFVAEGGPPHVFKIGGGGALTPVPGAFNFTPPAGFQPPNLPAVTATPTVFPKIGINGVQNAVCSAPGENPPTNQFLYAVDSVNNVVWEFSVNTSSGALGNPPNQTSVPFFRADQVPAGVAVDPCDRFVYVSDSLSNRVSAYILCAAVSQPTCPYADGSLAPVSGSPFSLSGSANSPGPLVVDPFGNNVYVVGTLSNTISLLKISPVSGSLSALTPATVATGSEPTSIAIRGDDSWLFVTNFNSASVSQYSVVPATGALSALAPIQTDNYPFGVAVK